MNENRFWNKVKITDADSCWEWQGCKNHDGYGMLWNPKLKKMKQAHRKSYTIANGPIPAGLVCRHICHNRGCVNPAHLTTGTQADNIKDMDEAGRRFVRRGEQAGRSKLTANQVLQIRKEKQDGVTYTELAKKYKVTDNSIAAIVMRKTWTHV